MLHAQSQIFCYSDSVASMHVSLRSSRVFGTLKVFQTGPYAKKPLLILYIVSLEEIYFPAIHSRRPCWLSHHSEGHPAQVNIAIPNKINFITKQHREVKQNYLHIVY